MEEDAKINLQINFIIFWKTHQQFDTTYHCRTMDIGQQGFFHVLRSKKSSKSSLNQQNSDNNNKNSSSYYYLYELLSYLLWPRRKTSQEFEKICEIKENE